MKLKKIFILPTFLCLIVMLIYCNIYMSKEKPSQNYYIDRLCTHLEKSKNPSDLDITLLTTDYYKFEKLIDDEKEKFITSLVTFKNSTVAINEEVKRATPRYKYIVEIKKEKYLVDVYDNKLISVYLWDGDYPKDFLTMTKGYPYENLYDISQSINGYDD